MKITKRTIKGLIKNRAKARRIRNSFRPPNLTHSKGSPGGNCNVTACQVPGAVFMNVGMRKLYYCMQCASRINENNVNEDFTIFPAFDEMKDRYTELLREGKDAKDLDNYKDIEQNPWGSCYHFDRDRMQESS